jgi:hypothetical protein
MFAASDTVCRFKNEQKIKFPSITKLVPASEKHAESEQELNSSETSCDNLVGEIKKNAKIIYIC